MTYLPDESKFVYRPKDKKKDKTLDSLEWMTAMFSHVPKKCEQMEHNYGHYSNALRGQRKKANEDGLVPCILQPVESSKGHLKN